MQLPRLCDCSCILKRRNSLEHVCIEYSKSEISGVYGYMLGNDYAQARKQYVEEVRRSFNHTEQDEYEQEPEAGAVSFFKVRLLIAVCIFTAFVLCDQTGSRFYHYSTDEIVEKLQQEQFQSQLDSIREAWNELTEK